MTTADQHPEAWAVTATRAILHVLPRGAVRDRWTQELLAELHGLDRREQLRHTAGVASRVLALRAAAARVTDPTEVVVLRRPWRCVLQRHVWRLNTTEDGTRYRRCRLCGKDDTSDALGPGDWAPTVGGTV